MVLLIDAGNTRLKWALTDSGSVVLNKGVADYDSIRDLLTTMPGGIDEVLVSCVAGDQKRELIVNTVDDLYLFKPSFASVSGQACGIENCYQSMETLGVDRWVAAIGAKDFVGNRIIVDAGTAVTIDLLDASNQFRGGVILPGLELMHSALVGETAGIAAKRDKADSVIGVTTQQCVNAGVNYGLVGAVEYIIAQIPKAAPNDELWQLIVCGGDGGWLVDKIKTELPVVLDEGLLFKGLLNMKNAGVF